MAVEDRGSFKPVLARTKEKDLLNLKRSRRRMKKICHLVKDPLTKT
jgi:hypothetical protein